MRLPVSPTIVTLACLAASINAVPVEVPLDVSTGTVTGEGLREAKGETSAGVRGPLAEGAASPSRVGAPTERFRLYYNYAKGKPVEAFDEAADHAYFMASRAAASSFYDIIDSAMVRDSSGGRPAVSEMEFMDMEADDALGSLLMLAESKRLPPLIVTHGGDTLVRHSLTENFIDRMYAQQGLTRDPSAVKIIPGSPSIHGPLKTAGEGILPPEKLAEVRPPPPEDAAARAAYDAKVKEAVAATREAIRAHLEAHEMTVIHMKAAPEDLGAVLAEHPELKKKVLIVWVSPLSLVTEGNRASTMMQFNARQTPEVTKMLFTDPEVRLLAINAGSRWAPPGLQGLLDTHLIESKTLPPKYGPGIKDMDAVLDNDKPDGFFSALKTNGRHFTDSLLPNLEEQLANPANTKFDRSFYEPLARVFRERKHFEGSSADLYLLPAVTPSLRQGSDFEHIAVDFSLHLPEGAKAPELKMQLNEKDPRKLVVTNFNTKSTYNLLQKVFTDERQKQLGGA